MIGTYGDLIAKQFNATEAKVFLNFLLQTQ